MKVHILLQRWFHRLGLLGAVGLGLSVFCCVYYASAVRPALTRAAQLEARLQQLAANRSTAPSAQPDAALRVATELGAFYRKFPVEASSTQQLRQIHAAAHAFNLRLPRGEYRVDRTGSSRLVRYELRFPLRGKYEDIRGFVARVLRETPTLALDDVSFERTRADHAETACTVQFSLFMLKGG
jgi:hypothetical protein